MAKKALVNKSNRRAKFRARAYTRCRRCGRQRAVFRRPAVFGSGRARPRHHYRFGRLLA